MGNTASSHQSKNAESDQSIPQKIIPLSGLESSETFVNSKSSNVKLVLNIDVIKLEEEGKTKSAEILSDCEKNRASAEESAASASANHQTRNQKSSLSFGSLRSISFGSANKKKKTKAKSLNSLQLKQYTNTTWPRPLKSSIFATHFSPANKANSAHYSIECLIAKGAYGAVYKVLQHQTPLDLEQQIAEEDFKQAVNTLDNVYALKVLKKSKIIDECNVEQIKTEVDILRLCGHHHFIVRLLNTWQTPRNLFILTEFVANGELFQKINKFTLELARLYVAEIALAIEFLHNAGIIYRDAKPENILLGSDYHIKLIDFGLSKRLKYGGRTNTICGTLDYMATKMNARSQVFDLTMEGRQVDEAVASIFHTVLFHRCLGKYMYTGDAQYSIGTVGYTDVDCDFIDFTYVCCTSDGLNRTVKRAINQFSEKLRSNDSCGSGQISLEFFQKKKSRWPFQQECIPWEVWTIHLDLIKYENEDDRQLSRENVSDLLTEKVIYITELMNRHDYVPKTPSQNELDLIFDTSYPDVQPYLFKLEFTTSGSSAPSVGNAMKKIIKETLAL